MITQPEHLAWAQRIMAEKSSYYKQSRKFNPNQTTYPKEENDFVLHYPRGFGNPNSIGNSKIFTSSFPYYKQITPISNSVDQPNTTLHKNEQIMNNFDAGLRLRYKGLEGERMETKYKRPSTLSQPQQTGKNNNYDNSDKNQTHAIHPNKFKYKFKPEIETQNNQSKMNISRKTIKEEDIRLPKMSAFPVKKQILIKNLMKETKNLDEFDSEELLREMHSIISRKSSNKHNEFNLNILTPENLLKFEEEQKEQNEQHERNRNRPFQSINFDDLSLSFNHPRSGNRCKRYLNNKVLFLNYHKTKEMITLFSAVNSLKKRKQIKSFRKRLIIINPFLKN